ncbi:MAG: glycosyltransferase family 2 protein [Chloroflexi bacterium]|nr:glycosyltransferase family 2 protein [Chloroflexota bacterium]
MKKFTREPHAPVPPKRTKTIAAIPAFNEEGYIGSIVLKTRQYVDEVIVVDDGSQDQTAKVARLAGATVVQHPRNSGYGASIQTLLAEAKKRNATIMVLLDGDFQHNPDDIPRLIAPLSEGFDLVIGSREQQKANIPRYRRAGQKIIAYFSGFLSGNKLADSESGFRVFSKKAITVLKLNEKGMAISAETIANAAENGLKITERPISIRYTRDGSTLNPVVHGVGVLSRVIIMISDKKPLFFFGLGGMILILLGIFTGLRASGGIPGVAEFTKGTAIVSTLLLFSGIFSIFTGITLNRLTRRRN